MTVKIFKFAGYVTKININLNLLNTLGLKFSIDQFGNTKKRKIYEKFKNV